MTITDWIFFSFLMLLASSVLFVGIKKTMTVVKQRKRVAEIFKNYNLQNPQFIIGRSYSWPTFEVVFSSQEEYNDMKNRGVFELIQSTLGSFYNAKFDPTIAITFKCAKD